MSIAEEYNSAHGEPFDPTRLIHFFYSLRRVAELPAGDYIELGTHKGLSAKCIYKMMPDDANFYILDTFEGFVKDDIVVEKSIYNNAWTVGNFAPTSPEEVVNYVTDGKNPENVIAVKGWFPESYEGLEDRSWRLVHIDLDLYQPIKKACEILWPQLVPGGMIIVHDYGCYGFPGAKMAVDEFCASVGVVPIEFADRWGSVCLVKHHTVDQAALA